MTSSCVRKVCNASKSVGSTGRINRCSVVRVGRSWFDGSGTVGSWALTTTKLSWSVLSIGDRLDKRFLDCEMLELRQVPGANIHSSRLA